jgi:hypothetical protein
MARSDIPHRCDSLPFLLFAERRSGTSPLGGARVPRTAFPVKSCASIAFQFLEISLFEFCRILLSQQRPNYLDTCDGDAEYSDPDHDADLDPVLELHPHIFAEWDSTNPITDSQCA